MASRNCFKCLHFTKSIVFEYSKSGNIESVSRIMKCDKLNLVFQMRNSEEKDNESFFRDIGKILALSCLGIGLISNRIACASSPFFTYFCIKAVSMDCGLALLVLFS